MKNTIEQALQRQREQEKKASAEKQKLSQSDSEELTSLEKAQARMSEELKSTEKNTLETEIAGNEQAQVEKVGSPASKNQKPKVKVPTSAIGSTVANTTEKAKETKTFDIKLERLGELGFVSLESARNVINEEYREIKRKLLQNAFGPLASTIPNSNIIMVSSARPAEGKTFTATNLALSIAAEQDKTVLLVDADVLKPNVLRTLDIDENVGLMEYLLGEVKDLSEVIYHTNIPKLKIIPAGQTHYLSTELLASTMMRETVEEFSTRYPDRVVIIDTPPLIGINESAVLANLAGQAVLVVEEGRSRMNDIQSAVDRLNPDMAIGFVLNKARQSTEKYGYYGYQYYGTY